MLVTAAAIEESIDFFIVFVDALRSVERRSFATEIIFCDFFEGMRFLCSDVSCRLRNGKGEWDFSIDEGKQLYRALFCLLRALFFAFAGRKEKEAERKSP